jgi:3',5'-nucleoside bisphosphate phosphatase
MRQDRETSPGAELAATTSAHGIDLHTHTTASDGALSPTELVDLAVERGVRVLAVTDHDTTDAIDSAIAHAGGRIEVWPGIEISSDIPGTEVHVLGYFLDRHQPELQSACTQFRESRLHRAEHMVEALNALGMRITWARVQEIAGGGSVGRPHVAQALVEAGYVQTTREAFDLYIGRNGPAYVERFKMSPEEAIRLVRAAGGLAVLAHPIYIDPSKSAGAGSATGFDLKGFVGDLVRSGIEGIESYYASYTPQQSQMMLDLAAEYDLIATGGTDFHGGSIGGPLPGEVVVPASTVAAMRAWRSTHGR